MSGRRTDAQSSGVRNEPEFRSACMANQADAELATARPTQ